MRIPDTFQELKNQLQSLYQEENYFAAIDLATAAIKVFQKQRAMLDYWHMMLLAKTGDFEMVIAAFEEAQDHGSWFSDVILRNSPSLKPLQGEPRFEVAVARNQQIAEIDHQNLFPYYVIRPEGKCQPGGNPCPLLMGLHNNGGTFENSIGFWKAAAAYGWLAAALQSSQALMKGVYTWDDQMIAAAEVKRDYESLLDHYPINPWQTILAGHGMGGETAIHLVLKEQIGVHSFLAICPNGPATKKPDSWGEILNQPIPDGLRGYLIGTETGSTIPHETLDEMAKRFNDRGIQTEIEFVEGAGSDYTPEFDEAIIRGLNFLGG